MRLLVAFALLTVGSLARAEFKVPALTGPVVDLAGMFSSGTRDRVERFLRDLHERGGTQLQVVAVPSLEGLTIEEAGIQIADKWRVGDAKKDNGVILIFAANERRVRIEVGQGREGDLPDITASRIIREAIIPRMRAGDPDGALRAGVVAIVQKTDPDFAPSREQTYERPARGGNLVFFLILLIVFGAVILPALFGRGGGFGGGGFGGFGGGGFGGGGFGGGGGGWSGGGGGFSGGGSSGSW